MLGTLEAHGKAYDGGLGLCGANAPAKELFNDGLFSPLVVFEHRHPGVLSPGDLMDAAAPRWPADEAIEAALQSDETFAAALGKAFGIPRQGMAGGLMLRFAVLHELRERAGGVPVDNTTVRYSGFADDAAVNAGVRRYAGDPAAMAYAEARLPLIGKTRRPVVLLANVVDEVIPASTSSRYLELARAVGRADRVVELASAGTEGHCRSPPGAEQQGAGRAEVLGPERPLGRCLPAWTNSSSCVNAHSIQCRTMRARIKQSAPPVPATGR